jgi:branched-chain amino acid transport system permease protein
MVLFIQFLINGLLVGGIYALLALAIVLICKSTRVFNFAMGEMMTLGAFILYAFLVTARLPLFLSLPLTALACLAAGNLIERLVLRPLIGQPILASIMATLALSLILKGIILFIWGSPTLSYPQKILPSEATVIWQFFFSNELLWTFVISIAGFVAMAFFFKFTQVGIFMRATAEGHEVAQAAGINVQQIFGITWAIAAVIAAIGGILLGNRFGLGIGTLPLVAIKAFPAVLFGGLESVLGAIVGGLTVGILESMVGGYVDPKYSEITPYIILLLVLLFRPEGLFGLKRIERI